MKKPVFVLVLILPVLFSFGSAQAAEAPRWDSVSVAYLSVEVDKENLTGFGISATKLLGEDFFVGGRYEHGSGDTVILGSKMDIDVKTFSLGIGYRYAISNNSDVFGRVSYEDAKVERSHHVRSTSESDNGYGLGIGFRSMLSEKFEIGCSVQYLDIADNTGIGFAASALYNITEQFSAGLGYRHIDDGDGFTASAHYFF